MKSIIKKIFGQSGEDPFRDNRGFTTKPLAQWKKNIFAVVAGLAIGLYVGQYFPDVFYPQVYPYIPEI